MMKNDRLSTADLARASEKDERAHQTDVDFRGPEPEQTRGQSVAEPPRQTLRPMGDRPAPAPTPQMTKPSHAPIVAPTAPANAPGERAALFRDNDADDLRKRWSDIQTGFVDEPRRAVEQADSLVADAMKRLAEGFAAERAQLEKQWDRGDTITTEDLRVALQRYRSFFDRLLAA
jgi:hypothetical protein